MRHCSPKPIGTALTPSSAALLPTERPPPRIHLCCWLLQPFHPPLLPHSVCSSNSEVLFSLLLTPFHTFVPLYILPFLSRMVPPPPPPRLLVCLENVCLSFKVYCKDLPTNTEYHLLVCQLVPIYGGLGETKERGRLFQISRGQL